MGWNSEDLIKEMNKLEAEATESVSEQKFDTEDTKTKINRSFDEAMKGAKEATKDGESKISMELFELIFEFSRKTLLAATDKGGGAVPQAFSSLLTALANNTSFLLAQVPLDMAKKTYWDSFNGVILHLNEELDNSRIHSGKQQNPFVMALGDGGTAEVMNHKDLDNLPQEIKEAMRQLFKTEALEKMGIGTSDTPHKDKMH